jgi:hypothetical protein
MLVGYQNSQNPELWTGCGGARFRRGLPGAAPLLEKWRSFTVYSHSSEILTFPGDPLLGTALVCSPLLLEKVQTTGTEFAVAMALNRSLRLQRCCSVWHWR